MNSYKWTLFAVAILAIDNRFGTPSLELKCFETSFDSVREKKSFQSLGTQDCCRVIIKAYSYIYSPEPRIHVYCLELNFNTSKLVYCRPSSKSERARNIGVVYHNSLHAHLH